MDNNKVAVVCIARMEGRYIREWVEHYLGLGFDNVIICDNNFGDEEHYDELLKDYINQGFVIIEDVRDKPGFQMQCYSIIYDKYKNDFSWMLMCDVDEFLTFTKDKDVKEFLSRFPDDAEVVVANWAQYRQGWTSICYLDKQSTYTYKPPGVLQCQGRKMPRLTIPAC